MQKAPASAGAFSLLWAEAERVLKAVKQRNEWPKEMLKRQRCPRWGRYYWWVVLATVFTTVLAWFDPARLN